MLVELQMPMLGEVMEEGVILAWTKKEGETVEKGETIFEVENDKAVMEVESPASGTVKSILVPANTSVPINTVLALIETTSA